MNTQPALHGLVAEFKEPRALLSATRAAHDAGFRHLEAYTPFPVEGLPEALGFRWNAIPLICLLCAILGGTLGYGMQYYSAVHDYALNVGGRPLHSWPSFVPITFELTVLFGALGSVLAMIALNGLPRLHHPIFNTPHFEARSHSHFYLCIEAGDPQFDLRQARALMDQHSPAALWEVARE